MLIINVIGGIGNQMFQIALCQALNEKGVSAALDLGGLKSMQMGMTMPWPMKYLILNKQYIILVY